MPLVWYGIWGDEVSETLRERREKRFVFREGRPLTEDDQNIILDQQASALLAYLYEPDAQLGWVANGNLVERFELDKDAINWGDLAVIDVAQTTDGSFIVYVEEVAPDAIHLQRWIEGWLKAWGWNASVVTEW